MEKKYAILPADDAVQNWFEENIDKECSASSAIYKFRLWLESLHRKPITGARWVKCWEQKPDTHKVRFKDKHGNEFIGNYSKDTGQYWAYGLGQAINDVIYWRPQDEAAVGREEDRNEFAEWCRMQPNYGYVRGMGWMCSITHEYFTTDFMYELFKQQKEK